MPRWTGADLPRPDDLRRMAGAAPSLSASEVLHDLSNALGAVMTMADVLLEQGGQSALAVGYLRIMRTSASDGFDVCQQLRRSLWESARLEQAQVALGGAASGPIDLSALVGEMSALLQTAVGGKAQLRFDLPADLPSVTGCAAHLREVLMNLVINAVQAQVGGEGTIRIQTGVIEPPAIATEGRQLMTGQLHPIAYVYLQVSDSGCGMAPEVKQRMFESRFTTKHAGRGDGLSVVRKIVESHGGAADVTDIAEGGTAVRLLLPAVDARRAAHV